MLANEYAQIAAPKKILIFCFKYIVVIGDPFIILITYASQRNISSYVKSHYLVRKTGDCAEVRTEVAAVLIRAECLLTTK
jgi:hypothetical protein